MHIKQSTLTFCICLLLAACGGGGDSNNSGSSSGSSSGSGTPSTANVQAIQVTNGPTGNYVNGLFTTVTVCQPGTNVCQDIDNVLVDTGSYGLRLMSSVVQISFPQQIDSNSQAPLLECAQFMSGYTWGTIKIADIKMAGEQASAVPIQIIGDPNYTSIPDSCNNTGKALNTVSAFGINGVLGVGPQQADCPTCTSTPTTAAYYACTTPNICTSVAVPATSQVQNPVYMFPTDNNGIVIKMPAIGSLGDLNTQGSLIFGIGTQNNNGLGNAKVITIDNNSYFTATYKSRTFSKSFLDSGSNGLFFNDLTLSPCAGWYCPAITQNLSATHTGGNGTSSTVNFSIANSKNLFQTSNNAFNNLGGTEGSSITFDWGLPFFYGRTVYTAYQNKNTPAGTGPYIAY